MMKPLSSCKPLMVGLLGCCLLVACTESESGVALGTIERDRITLTATAAELIVAQPIAEGATVSTGELLVQLDTTLQRSQVAQAEAQVARLEAFLTQLRAGPRPEELAAAMARVESARATLAESDQDLLRIQQLVERAAAPRADLETANARRDANAARLRDAQAQLDLLRAGTRAEELAQAEAQLAASRAQLEGERQRLANLSIVATRDGILDSLPLQVGERVANGQTVAVILVAGAPYARLYLPESARAQLRVGSSLQVRVDGYAETFGGTVRWIALEPAFTPYYALNSAERSRLVWLTEVQLPDSATSLPAGLPAQAVLP